MADDNGFGSVDPEQAAGLETVPEGSNEGSSSNSNSGSNTSSNSDSSNSNSSSNTSNTNSSNSSNSNSSADYGEPTNEGAAGEAPPAPVPVEAKPKTPKQSKLIEERSKTLDIMRAEYAKRFGADKKAPKAKAYDASGLTTIRLQQGNAAFRAELEKRIQRNMARKTAAPAPNAASASAAPMSNAAAARSLNSVEAELVKALERVRLLKAAAAGSMNTNVNAATRNANKALKGVPATKTRKAKAPAAAAAADGKTVVQRQANVRADLAAAAANAGIKVGLGLDIVARMAALRLKEGDEAYGAKIQLYIDTVKAGKKPTAVNLGLISKANQNARTAKSAAARERRKGASATKKKSGSKSSSNSD